ncbi:MAG: NAD(P)-dependent oxidoreductase [Alphaproteobacteria bacterium]
MTGPVIGLIGMGLLGGAIAERLAAAEYKLLGYDKDPERLAEVSGNLTPAPDANAVFGAADIVLLSLPHGGIVASVLELAAPVLRPDQLVLDTTTGTPEQATAAAALLRRSQARYVDATVAGSSQQLRDRAATMFIGAAENDLGAGHAVIDALTSRPFYLGAIGQAARFKLVHNLILGLNRAALAEALLFGQSMGIAPADTLRILEQTPAASTVMQTKGHKMVTRDYAPQALISQHLKDVRLILEQAKTHGAPTPLSAVHRRILERAEARGFGDADNSAVIEGLDIDATNP